MDTPLEKTPAPNTPPDGEVADLQEQCRSLRQQVAMLVAILIVLSGTLNVFFRHAWNYTRADMNASQHMAAQADGQYTMHSNDMKHVVTVLTDYGRAHPDFMPILNRYGISNAPAPSLTPGAPKQ